jgi:hypothetical protein
MAMTIELVEGIAGGFTIYCRRTSGGRFAVILLSTVFLLPLFAQIINPVLLCVVLGLLILAWCVMYIRQDWQFGEGVWATAHLKIAEPVIVVGYDRDIPQSPSDVVKHAVDSVASGFVSLETGIPLQGVISSYCNASVYPVEQIVSIGVFTTLFGDRAPCILLVSGKKKRLCRPQSISRMAINAIGEKIAKSLGKPFVAV